MTSIRDIAARADVRRAMSGFQDQLDDILDSIIRIQQVPAPTFAEAARARYLEQQFRGLGLLDVSRDGIDNVYGRLAGGGGSTRPPVIVSAHLDTVFPAGTALDVQRHGDLLCGPGIGDNCTGLGGLLALARAMGGLSGTHPADIWFVGNVGEEGLGDLRGMRAVVERFGSRAQYVVVEGGLFGQLSHEAIGVRRFHIEVEGAGGHSWGNFGTVSAIHVLGRLISAIDDISVPHSPKTTYNVGLIEGGISINSIASSAGLWLDLRSEAPEELTKLIGQVQEIIARISQEYATQKTGIQLKQTVVGDRPAGSIPRTAPLVAWAEEALHVVGCNEVRFIAGSTDANIPLSKGMPAVCLGLTESGNSHRTDEYIEVTRLAAGLGQLLLVTLAAAGY